MVPTSAASAALVGTTAGEIDAREIGHLVVRDTEPPEDLHASAGLRRRAAAALTTQALHEALEEARDG